MAEMQPPKCFGLVDRFKPHPKSVCMTVCEHKNPCIDKIHGVTKRFFDAGYKKDDGIQYSYNEIARQNKRASEVKRTDRLVRMFNSIGKDRR